MTRFFHDRHEAGKSLAKKLSPYMERDDVLVLALPRGGVPVAFEVAQALRAPLDLMLVRKLGVPEQPELAMGALAMPDICVFNHDIILNAQVAQEDIDRVIARETTELSRRNRHYRNGEPPPDVKDRVIILVDDGAATGATMHAAISAVAQQMPLRVIAAIPVASEQAYEMLSQRADEVACLQVPEPFFGVSRFYEEFEQTTDEEVMELLEHARHWGKGGIHFAEEHEHARPRL